MQHFGVVYSAMQLKSDQIAEEVETAQRFNIDQGMFAKFLGLCVRMAMYCLPNRDNYCTKVGMMGLNTTLVGL